MREEVTGHSPSGSECEEEGFSLGSAVCLFQCPVARAREGVLPPLWGAVRHLLGQAWRQDFQDRYRQGTGEEG